MTPLATVALLVALLNGLSTGARAHTGDWIDSGYTTAPPTVDGALSPGEWVDAAPVDLGAIAGNRLPAFLLVENDASFLYIAYDATGDTTQDFADQASVSFDTAHDGAGTFGREDEFWWGLGATNGQSHWTYDGAFWSEEDSPFNTSLPNHAGLASAYGFGPSDLSPADHQVYELQIPLALLGISPGEVIGLLGASSASPGVLDASSFGYSTWPYFLFGPPTLDRYGDLRLGQPQQLDDLDLNPPSQVGRTAPLSSILYTVTAVNRGTSNDTFEIDVFSGWTATLLDTSLNPLADTNLDGTPDTGSLMANTSGDFVVQIDVPNTTGCDDAFVTGTSANDPGVSDFTILHTCVPPAFLSPPHSDMGVDTDTPPNGLFNVLELGVQTEVFTADQYSFLVQLYDASQTTIITTGFASASLTVGTQTVIVNLPGQDIWRNGINGSYLAVIHLFDPFFVEIDTGTHMTVAYNFTAFDPPAALFSPPHSDRGVDTDAPPNNLYDWLEVDVNLTVSTPGFFRIEAGLFDSAFNFVSSATVVGSLGAGNQQMQLAFLGREISNSGRDGPYNALMNLYDAFGTFLDSGLHTTGLYLANQSEPWPALFSPPHTDRGVDLTMPPDGAFEYLEINASVVVTKAGEYGVTVDLWDGSGSFYIATATTSVHLSAGPQGVPVWLNGVAIRNSGFDGPYFADLTLRDSLGGLDTNGYSTGPYARAEFAPPGARLIPPYTDRLVDMDGDGLADFLAVDVPVLVTDPGWYSLQGAIIDSQGRILGASNGCGTLAGGAQMCTLLFDGHMIAESGSQGPFTADFRLFDANGRFLGRDFHTTGPYANSDFEPADTAAPTSTAGTVPYWINRAPLDVSYGASDPSPTDGLSSVSLLFRYSANNATWGAWTTYATVPAIGRTASGTLPFTFPSGVGFYEFQYTATDVAGNMETISAAETRAMYRPLGSLAFSPATLNVPAGQQRPVSVRVLGTDGLAATLQSPLTVSLYTTSPTGGFRAVGTSTTVTSITIPAGQSSGSVDFYDTTAGSWDMLASSGPTTEATGQVTVSAGPAASVTVSPTNPAVLVGSVYSFSAQAWDLYGNTIASPALTWTADLAVGTISGAGVLTAATRVASGNVTVEITGSPATRVTARVVLVPGPAASVGVAPASVTLQVTATWQFRAVALDAYGNAVTAALVWSASAGIGTIDPATGMFTAGQTVRTGTVTATVASTAVSGTATVTLTPGPATTITFSPPSASLAVDASQAFTNVVVLDQYGNAIANPPVTWSIVGSIGTIDGTGVFTAGHLATVGEVWATSGSAQASAVVTVTPGPADRVVVTPSSLALVVGGTQTFTASVTDEYGNAVTTTVTWSVDAALGTINSSGVFTAAQTVAHGSVSATVVGLAPGQAGVALYHDAPYALRLSPSRATLQYNTAVGLQASVVDRFGNLIDDATAAITWSANGPGATITNLPGPTATLNVTQGGTVTVTASSGLLSGTATFTVLGAAPPSTPEASNAPLIGVGALIAGLIVGLAIGWVVRARRGTPSEAESEEEEEEAPTEEEGESEESTEEDESA